MEVLLHLDHSSPSVNLSSLLSGDSFSTSSRLPIPTPGIHQTPVFLFQVITEHYLIPCCGKHADGNGCSPSLSPTFFLSHG